jgi:uncharacterized membrane protein YhaH (DUF805 family)
MFNNEINLMKPWNFFKNNSLGRISRFHLLEGLLFCSALYFVIIGIIIFLNKIIEKTNISTILIVVTVVVLTFIYILSLIILLRGRLHDIGYSGVWLLLSWIIPPLGIILVLYLLFKKGNSNKNQFGEPNKILT